MASGSPLDDDLIHAITVINDVVFDLRHHDAVAIASAHNTLAQCRRAVHRPLRDAIDRYLDDHTWQHGPQLLRHTVGEIARHAGIPDSVAARVSEQPALF